MPDAIYTLTLADARRLIKAAEAKAQAIGARYAVAVVDAGANPVAQIRMDGAWLGAVEAAADRALAARAFDAPAEEAGGLPVKFGGKVVGAIGCAGGTADQDAAVATAAIAAYEASL